MVSGSESPNHKITFGGTMPRMTFTGCFGARSLQSPRGCATLTSWLESRRTGMTQSRATNQGIGSRMCAGCGRVLCTSLAWNRSTSSPELRCSSLCSCPIWRIWLSPRPRGNMCLSGLRTSVFPPCSAF